MKYPDFSYEMPLWEKGYTIIGIDEVGRGAFAGPVGVGGVIFDPQMSGSQKKELLGLGINDSKKLTAKKRLELSKMIKDIAISWNVSLISVEIINDIGIGKATFLGMRRVFEIIQSKLPSSNSYLLIDGFEIPGFEIPQKGIIGGDGLSISIAAASIVAKVERDTLMERLGITSPQYGFEKHKGYGTRDHRESIQKFGLTPHHRVDFCQNTLKAV